MTIEFKHLIAIENNIFATNRMVIGMTTSGVFLVSYVSWPWRWLDPSTGVIAGTLCQYYYTFGFFVMALVAYFLNHDWKLLQIVLSLPPTLLFVSYFWFIPESVRMDDQVSHILSRQFFQSLG